jgi:hypothetical protein
LPGEEILNDIFVGQIAAKQILCELRTAKILHQPIRFEVEQRLQLENLTSQIPSGIFGLF